VAQCGLSISLVPQTFGCRRLLRCGLSPGSGWGNPATMGDDTRMADVLWGFEAARAGVDIIFHWVAIPVNSVFDINCAIFLSCQCLRLSIKLWKMPGKPGSRIIPSPMHDGACGSCMGYINWC